MRYTQAEWIVGKVVANVHLIEILKRYPLHAHCISFLKENSKDKLNSPKYVNTLIRANIFPKSDQQLQEDALRHSIYNLCDDLGS